MIGRKGLRFFGPSQSRMRFSPRPLAKLAALPLDLPAEPAFSFTSYLPTRPKLQARRRRCLLTSLLCTSSSLVEQKSSHSFLDLCFFPPIHTLLQLHSLFQTTTDSLLERAGLKFNSRYDLKSPVFIVANTAAVSHVACFPLSGDQRNTAVPFTSSFSLCPLPRHSRIRTAWSYIHTVIPAKP